MTASRGMSMALVPAFVLSLVARAATDTLKDDCVSGDASS